MFQTEFVWTVPNDDNRVADGRCLRDEFLLERDIHPVDSAWYELGCSFFEMLIGLSRRLAFEAGEDSKWWFWKLLDNLNFRNFADDNIFDDDEVSLRLDEVIWRRYEPNGMGGLFPLAHPKEDQTKVEIWYQMNAYLLENNLM
jgi:hypothetical protein